MGSATDIALSIDPIQNDEGEEPFLQEEEPGDGHALPSERTSDLPPPEAPIITSPPQTYKPDVYDLEWRPGRDWSSPISAYFVKYRKVSDAPTHRFKPAFDWLNLSPSSEGTSVL